MSDKEHQERPEEPDRAGPLAPESYPAARDLASALTPLKDLAEAFRENTDTLRAIADGQNRMAKRIERSDRSEAVIQSTKALNDTFRGVRKTQERLMGRLDGERRRPVYLLVLALALTGILVGGTIWYLLGWVDRREAATRAGDREDWSAVLAVEQDRNERLSDRVTELTSALERANAATLAAEGDSEALRDRMRELEAANEELEASRAGFARLSRENASLETEVSDVSRQLAEAREKERELSDEIAEKDAELARQGRKIEELARRVILGGPVAPAAAAAPAPATPPRPEPAADEPEATVPREAARNPAELARVADILNRLLLDTKGSESYRVKSIGGIRGKILFNVVVASVDGTGREAKRIEAAECRVVVDETQRRAELRFRSGHIVYYGVRAPFWGGSYVVPVVNIDPNAWLRSGLTVIDQV